MTLDPVFEADAGAASITGQIDLSNQITLWRCTSVVPERVPSRCGFNYCGAGATCAESNGTYACRCAAGQVAQRITGPDGVDHLTCVPADNPFGITAEASGVGSDFDPCLTYTCSEGTCIMKSGFPTCQCGDNFATLVTGGVACRTTVSDATFGPGAGSEARPVVTASASSMLRADQQRTTALGRLPGTPVLLMVGYLLWSVRRARVEA